MLKYSLAVDAPGDYVVKAPGASILCLRGIQFGYHYLIAASTYNLMYVPNLPFFQLGRKR